MISARDRAQAAQEAALRKVHSAPRPVLRFAMTLIRQMTNIEPFDRAMTLAAQAFTSIFPVLITLVAFAENEDGRVAQDLAEALSLPESMQTALDDVLPVDTQQFAAVGFIGVLIVLVSATSFSRALGRMYAKAWHERQSGWGGGWRWIVVIVAICSVTVAAQQVYSAAAGNVAWVLAALLLIFAFNVVLWILVPWLLLVGRVSVIRLLPGAILMAIGSVCLSLAGRIYLPHALKIGADHFGALGVAFTLIGWLFCVGFVLVGTTVVGAVIVNDETIRGLVRRVQNGLAVPLAWGRRAEGQPPADRGEGHVTPPGS